ncbi:MAG: secretin N-terminal domain-containing protein [Candidatus Pacebacteria bacterium]|nr:secretin N-terminal domain-containing protein [Candidatus Paceibacterota bacterium]
MKFFPLALLFSGVVFFSVTAHAQVAAQTSIPADLTLGGDTKATEGSTSEMISPDTIQFPNNPVSDFLMIYEKLKGVTLIKDASLLAGGANLSLTLNQPVSKAEAIRLLESTLLLNGYAFIAVDKNSVKVINTAGGKNPRSEGVFLFTNESELPDGEVVASYVLPLTHLAASDAVEIFNQFIVLHPYGSMVAVPVANQVVITENSTLIRRLIDVKNLIDIPAPEKKSEFITLAQANADRVVELITTILEKRQEGASGGSGKAATGQAAQPPVPGLQAPGGGATGVTISGGKSGFAGDIQLIADTRTNRILVIASPFDFTAIQALIQQFDIAVELTDPYEHSLNYVAATDMLQILGDMLKEEGDEGGDSTAGGSQSTGKVSGGIGTGGVVAGGASSSSSSSGRKADVLSEPGEEQAAESLIVGKTKLIADNRANSILVIGQPEAKDKVKAILTKLDKKPMQVYLATVIGQLTLNNQDEFAVNILQKYIGGNRTGSASAMGGKQIVDPGTIVYGTTTNGVPYSQFQAGKTPLTKEQAQQIGQIAQMATGALPGMQIATFILGSIDLYINALTVTDRFRIASRPAVFTANNKKATIYNGTKIAVPTSTVTTLGGGGSANATSGSQQSNIQYQDVVLKIEVVPLINSAKEISLQIVQTNDTLSQTTQAVGGGVQVPDINTQELNTTVIVPDRATVLLGGLVTQQDTKNVAGVPFLSTIPLMGNLFKSTSDTTNRQELVVMIQPTIVQDNKELSEASKTERDLTGFSAKELQPLTMKSGSKSKDVGLQAAGTDSVPAEEPKQE